MESSLGLEDNSKGDPFNPVALIILVLGRSYNCIGMQGVAVKYRAKISIKGNFLCWLNG